MLVMKRDGTYVEFQKDKISKAISKANKSLSTPELTQSDIESVTDSIVSKLDEKDTTVESIQDLVEKELINRNFSNTAKEYILYRNKRTQVRENKSYIANVMKEFTFKDAEENEEARANANINADSAMGSMLYYGSETSKWFTLNHILRPEHAKHHKDGTYHIHDLDFYNLTLNCLQIPADKLLNKGFFTGHGFIRPPSNIKTACNLCNIIVQSNQNEMFGGQSIPMLDYTLAPYVKKSYIKNLIKILDIASNCKQEVLDKLKDKLSDYGGSLIDNNDLIVRTMCECGFDHDLSVGKLYDCVKKAYDWTDKDTYQGMEALVHNFSTMSSRAGAQVPFSSLNFGTDTTAEGRMVTKNLLLAQEAGLGNGETAIFPITVFTLMKGYNYYETDPNYDLFKLACRVSAKRLFPNFYNNSASWNIKYFKEGHPETIVSVMGATTGDVYVTINDYQIAPNITTEYKKVTIHDFIEGYFRYINTNPENKNKIQWKKAANLDNTYYVDVDPEHGVMIYDGNGFTRVKKFMFWDKADYTKWYKCKFSYTYPSKEDLKPGSGRYTNTTIEQVLYFTHDHPLSVIIDGKCKRVLLDDLYSKFNLGDRNILIESVNANQYKCKCILKDISEVYDDYEKPTLAYDFETESDKFAVSSGEDINIQIVSHNCRTRVIGNSVNPNKEITPGRGNLSFTTINLPKLGLLAKKDISEFYKLLDDTLDEVAEQLIDRAKVQANRKAKNFPFLVQQHLLMDSEHLEPNDKLGDIIKNGTLSIGFAGLAECLIALTGKHHGESEESQKIGLAIISHMNDRMKEFTQKFNYNFSLFASPAESTCGKFAILNRRQFGLIEGVTDRDYVTNSNHVPVYYKCTIAHKIAVEAPYHKYCAAGSIFYTEMDGDLTNNLEAFETVVKAAADADMGYISINHPVDRCPVCHYVGVIGDTCPRCGRTEDSWPTREKLEELKRIDPTIEIPDWMYDEE